MEFNPFITYYLEGAVSYYSYNVRKILPVPENLKLSILAHSHPVNITGSSVKVGGLSSISIALWTFNILGIPFE